jgi:hypothetical protein
MTDHTAETIAVHLTPPQAGCILALIQTHQTGVRAKLQNSNLNPTERAVLEELKLQLCEHMASYRALATADLLLSGSGS